MTSPLYPLRFREILRDYGFGDRWIPEVFDKTGLQAPADHSIAETWEWCDRPEESSAVINGPLAGASAAGHRVMMTMYAGTDQCFALAMGKVAARGGQTLAIWDNVNAGSKYTRDKYMCSLGIPTYVSRWANGDAQVRNHNKTIIVDDTVIDGSMNISSSGLDKNSENTLVIKSPRLAAKFASYIQAESELIETIASALTDPDKINYHLRLRSYASPEEVKASRERCMAIDLIDNDGDGLYDENDPDGDLGTQP